MYINNESVCRKGCLGMVHLLFGVCRCGDMTDIGTSTVATNFGIFFQQFIKKFAP